MSRMIRKLITTHCLIFTCIKTTTCEKIETNDEIFIRPSLDLVAMNVPGTGGEEYYFGKPIYSPAMIVAKGYVPGDITERNYCIYTYFDTVDHPTEPLDSINWESLPYVESIVEFDSKMTKQECYELILGKHGGVMRIIKNIQHNNEEQIPYLGMYILDFAKDWWFDQEMKSLPNPECDPKPEIEQKCECKNKTISTTKLDSSIKELQGAVKSLKHVKTCNRCVRKVYDFMDMVICAILIVLCAQVILSIGFKKN